MFCKCDRSTRLFIIPFSIIFSLLIIKTAGAQPERRSYIKEEFLAFSKDRNQYDPYPYGRNNNVDTAAQIWHKILLSQNIKNPTPDIEYNFRGCQYGTALNVLENIRSEFGINSFYERIWLINQNIVFSVCDQRQNNTQKLITLAFSNLPDRADSDFKYQLASWNFYQGKTEEAFQIYQELENELAAPMRPYASYMVMRLLWELEGTEVAYQKAQQILADDSLVSIHNMTRNYRFVLMYGHQNKSIKTATEHLEWLLEVVRLKPQNSYDLDSSLEDYFDAMHHLNNYFPSYNGQRKIDWWLHDYKTESPRMEAVKATYQKDDIVAWMAADWSKNYFDTDWLWALHDQENDYWQQNQNIVNYAWQRWWKGDGLEWLEIAITRVHPKDPLSEKILEEANVYLDLIWENETQEFKTWLVTLWTHSLRIRLGREEYQYAYDWALTHYNIINLEEVPSSYNSYQYNAGLGFQTYQTLHKAMRWLFYNGEIDQARNFLNLAHEIHTRHLPEELFKKWDIILAETWEDTINEVVLSRQNSSSYHPLWLRMLNPLPMEEQYRLIEEVGLSKDVKAQLALSVLTRALLLKEKNDLEEYALTAIEYNPDYRNRILSAVSGQKEDNYIDLLVRTPRLRPIPFQFIQKNYYYPQNELSPEQIDVFNHNDNNWWCRVAEEDLDNEVFEEAKIVLPIYSVIKPTNQDEYIKNQKAILAQHPYKQLIDQNEIERLEAIPHAPKYLSQAIIDREWWNWWKFWRSSESRSKSAADLHYAIRTTRYGCQKNGSHAEYSQEAFKILHQSYPDTTWAKATPYWFSCKHFRNGCEQ